MVFILNAMLGIEKVSSPLPSQTSKQSQRQNIKRAHGRDEPCAHYSIFMRKHKSVYEDIGHSRTIPHSLNFFFLNQRV